MKEKNTKTAVILLGSGFAIPFGGPSSSELLQRIEDHPYTNNSDVLKSQLISQLLIALRNYYGPNPVNFETLIASLESLCQYNVSSIQKNRLVDYASILPAIYLQKCFTELIEHEASRVNQSIPSFLTGVHKHCITTILDRIYEYDVLNIHKHKKDVSNSTIRFIDSLIDKGYKVKIYTTNYDRIIPKIMPNISFDEGLEEPINEMIENNFDATQISQVTDTESTIAAMEAIAHSNVKFDCPDMKPHFFHNDLMRFHNAPYTYFNLHGSRYLSWNYSRQCPCFYEIGTDYKSSIGQYNPGGNPNEYLPFAPIIVGYTKSQRALTEPFHFGFTSFAMDCNDCDKFFSFGFSYKDPHINSIINTYLRSDVKIECVVKDELIEEANTPKQLQHQRKIADETIVNCNSGKIIIQDAKDYLKNNCYEEYIG